jgi:predicted adenylyl cyclase CyaB
MPQEVELKFLLSSKDKTALQNFLQAQNAQLVKREIQENWYYATQGDTDLRIRRTDTKAFLILKKGWMHNENREEVEVEVKREAFELLDTILRSLGYDYDTKWYRERTEYILDNFTITLDFNAGYGWVAEIEQVVPAGKEDQAREAIVQLARRIGLKPTPKEIFDKMYQHYKKNWQYYIEEKTVFSFEDIAQL